MVTGRPLNVILCFERSIKDIEDVGRHFSFLKELINTVSGSAFFLKKAPLGIIAQRSARLILIPARGIGSADRGRNSVLIISSGASILRGSRWKSLNRGVPTRVCGVS
jgi:hypothetical protein